MSRYISSGTVARGSGATGTEYGGAYGKGLGIVNIIPRQDVIGAGLVAVGAP